jgi:hypothetical protein
MEDRDLSERVAPALDFEQLERLVGTLTTSNAGKVLLTQAVVYDFPP